MRQIMIIIGLMLVGAIWAPPPPPIDAAQQDDDGYSYITFGNLSDDSGLHILDYATREVVTLAESTQPQDIHWSPDGQRIAFRSPVFGSQNTRNTYILDVDGSRFVEIAWDSLPLECGQWTTSWRWTRDGAYIAYGCDVSVNGATRYQMLLMASDGSGDYEIPDFDLPVPCYRFDFSLDGQSLICGSSYLTEHTTAVSAIDMQDGHLQTIYTADYNSHLPAPREDVYIQRDILGVFVLDEERILLRYNISPIHFETISFDGEVLQHATLDNEGHAWGSESTRVSPSPDGSRGAFNALNIHLATFDFATEEVEILYTDEQDWVYYPDWSPLLDDPLDLPDEPYSLETLCGLLEESGGACPADILRGTE